jgi:hypothetical protein
MRRPAGRFPLAVIAGVAVIAVALLAWVRLHADGTAPQATTATTATMPALRAEVFQLRRDAVLSRVQVTVTNTRTQDIHVDRMQLMAPGFGPVPVVSTDAPITPGLQVDLPTPYGTPRCDAAPVGRPAVRLWVRTGGGPVESLTLQPTDPDGTLGLIHARECLARRLASEVRLSFGTQWRREATVDGVRLHGTLQARLLQPKLRRNVTQLAGTVIYSLAPDASGAPPFARLDAGHPTAAIPVVVSVSRCDGHARGETKQPYAFLVWIAAPGGPEQALTMTVTPSDKAQLNLVCPL